MQIITPRLKFKQKLTYTCLYHLISRLRGYYTNQNLQQYLPHCPKRGTAAEFGIPRTEGLLSSKMRKVYSTYDQMQTSVPRKLSMVSEKEEGDTFWFD